MPGLSSPAPDLWLIHGNLQTPAVWKAFVPRFLAAGLKVHLVDLYATLADSMEAWAEAFTTSVRVAGEPHARVVLGYSLGARLALHALLADPTLWNGAILVGADTGLADEEARVRRRETDAVWARRFLEEPIDRVMEDWNAQPVFGGRPALCHDHTVPRERQPIARMFTAYSKGRQRDLLPDLGRTIDVPTLWLTGADDPVFTRSAQSAVAAIPGARHEIIPGAAHRVPWENPNAFLEAVITCAIPP
ncbi:MAG: alpha/beta fold hydrolase [Rhodothermales bacterium]|nr:alpha/beta fold hydrolase [Rhodothermales bacterium]